MLAQLRELGRTESRFEPGLGCHQTLVASQLCRGVLEFQPEVRTWIPGSDSSLHAELSLHVSHVGTS